MAEYYGLTDEELIQLAGKSDEYIERFLLDKINQGIITTDYNPDETVLIKAEKKAAELWNYVVGWQDYFSQISGEQRSTFIQNLQAEQTIARQEEDAMLREQGVHRFGNRYMQYPDPAGVSSELRSRKVAERAAEAERKWYEEVPDRMPGYQGAGEKALGGLSGGAMQRYFGREMPSIYAELGMPEKRAEWWKEKYTWPGMGPTVTTRPGTGGGNIMSGENLQDEREREEWEQRVEAKRTARDPFDVFLEEEFPDYAREKWRSLSPQARGYRSSTYRPRARYLKRY